MPSSKLFADDFPSTSYADWRRQVERSLGEVPFDRAWVDRISAGLDIEPLYTAGEAAPAEDSAAAKQTSARDPGWQVVAEIASSDPAEARRALQQALALGVEQLWLRIDPEGEHGIALSTPAALENLLAGVDPRFVSLQLDAGSETQVWTTALRHWAGQQSGESVLRGGLGADPLGTLAARGGRAAEFDEALAGWVQLAQWSLSKAPELRAGLVSSVVYHEAGASAVEELAYALASGVLYLRRLLDAGVGVDQAASQLRFAFAIGSDTFLEIAKLRAARLLWAKVLGAGGASGGEMCLHGRTSAASQTTRHVAGNWLRATAQALAAAVGGVDSLAVMPYDTVLGQPSRSGRRLALTLQHVLAEEVHLGRVADPAAGSWYVESLTDDLARSAWDLFRRIESYGGMALWLNSGRVAERLQELAGERRRAVARREAPIVGVSQFVDLDEQHERGLQTVPEAAEEGSSSRSTEEGGTCGQRWLAALMPVRWSEPFEALHASSEGWQAAHGQRPQVFLANLGSLIEHGPRTAFARDLLAAGGLQAESGPSSLDDDAIVEAFRATRARLAVVCGSDAAYGERLAGVASRLLAAGAQRLLVAGRPPGDQEPSWRAAGIAGFLYRGGDALAAMAALHAVLTAKQKPTASAEKS